MKIKYIYTIVGIVLLLIIITGMTVIYKKSDLATNNDIDNSALAYKAGASGTGAGYVTLKLTGGYSGGQGTILDGTNIKKGKMTFKRSISGEEITKDGCEVISSRAVCILTYKIGEKVSLRVSPNLKRGSNNTVALWKGNNDILPCQNPMNTNMNLSKECSFIITKNTDIIVSFFDGNINRLGNQTSPLEEITKVPYKYLDSTDPYYMGAILSDSYTLGLKQVGQGTLDVKGMYGDLKNEGNGEGRDFTIIGETLDNRSDLDYFRLFRTYKGATINLVAHPPAFEDFGGVKYVNHWFGACSGIGLTCKVIMNGNKNVTAMSKPANLRKRVVFLSFEDGYRDDLNVNGKPAKIYKGSNNETLYQKIPFYLGTKVVVTRQDSKYASEYLWKGACAGTPAGQSCTITMDSDKTVGSEYITDNLRE